jgi:hypothetical protein
MHITGQASHWDVPGDSGNMKTHDGFGTTCCGRQLRDQSLRPCAIE